MAADENILSQTISTIQAFWANERVQFSTSIIGTAVVLYLTFRAISTLYFWIKPSSLKRYCHSESGSWALVTGASDGIGQAFCDELLLQGFNVLLHGRNPAKLDRVCKALLAKHPQRSVGIVVADASKQDDSYMAVVEKVKQLPGRLTMLVNNVGGISTTPQYLTHSEIPHENIDTILNINVRFPVHLTRELLPILQESTPSLILNCGSTAGVLGMPFITTYSGTKSYIHQFTNSLRSELRAQGFNDIEVLGLMIGDVESATNTHKSSSSTTSRHCAVSSLARVGCGSTLTFTDWTLAFQVWAVQLLPEAMMQKILASEMEKRREVEMKKAM